MSHQPGTIPPHFIVIVPGYMGSKLRERTTGKILWVDFASIPKNPLQWDDWLDHLLETMAYPNDDLEAAGIMDEVVFVPPWAKQEHYSRLIQALQEMGYKTDPAQYAEAELDVYSFAYDWRQDNRLSARQLGEAIERWRSFHPGAQAWIIAHSNGGLVARWYIEKEGGKERVGRFFLMGSPWDGTPKAMSMLFGGLETLLRRGFDALNIARRSRDLVRTFPSLYQLVPCQDPFLRDPNGQPVDPFSGRAWLDNSRQRQLLLDGRRFTQELGTTLSVETLCFFGRKKPTTTNGVVHLAAGGRWSDIEWLATEAGDGTIPERSAVHPQAQAKLPFAAGHGDIYVNPAVLEFLEWELRAKYPQPMRAVAMTSELSVTFEPDRDSYAPGESIALSASILGAPDREGRPTPVEGAVIETQLTWQEPLPGAYRRPSRARPVSVLLHPTAEPGRYIGEVRAPRREGYYRLSAIVKAAGSAPIVLSELVAVEQAIK